jgi:hypothetical protein
MRNLRKKIATVTKEEATKELTDFILKWLYKEIDDIVVEYTRFICNITIDEYLEMSENEQMNDIKEYIDETTYGAQGNPELEEWTLSEFFKDKDISDEDKGIYEKVLRRASLEATTNKKFLNIFKEKVDKEVNKQKENWNTKNNVNPDFNKGMNKINCIRVRLQKKLS